MAKVTWIKGTIDPPQSGEYYVTLEAKQDIINPATGNVLYRTGDVSAKEKLVREWSPRPFCGLYELKIQKMDGEEKK